MRNITGSILFFFLFSVSFLFFSGCSLISGFKDYNFTESDGDSDVDGDADVDGDTDVDGDSDIDADGDSDADGDTGVIEFEFMAIALGCNPDVDDPCLCGLEMDEIFACSPDPRWIAEGRPPPLSGEIRINFEYQSEDAGMTNLTYFLGDDEIESADFDPPTMDLYDTRTFFADNHPEGEQILAVEITLEGSPDPIRFEREIDLVHYCDPTGWQRIGSMMEFDPHDDPNEPSIATKDGEAVIAWIEYPSSFSRLNFARIYSDGTNETVNGPDLSSGVGPSIAAFPEGYGVAWSENMGSSNVRANFQVFDNDLSPISDPTTLGFSGTGQANLKVAAGADEFGIVWHSWSDSTIYFARTDYEGNIVPISGSQRIALIEPGTFLYFPHDLFWSPEFEEYMIAWIRYPTDYSRSDIFVGRFESGRLINQEIRVNTTNDARSVAIALANDHIGVGYLEVHTDPTMVKFAILRPSDSGIALISESNISAYDDPSIQRLPRGIDLAWSGEHYGIIWGDGGNIAFGAVDADGIRLFSPEIFSASSESVNLYTPVVSWLGYAFATAWSGRGTNYHLAAGRFEFACAE